MNSDADFSNFDLDDLLNQAADLESTEETEPNGARSGPAPSPAPRRGLFSGRTASKKSPSGSSKTGTRSGAASSPQKPSAGSAASGQTPEPASDKEASSKTSTPHVSKTPPKPVESPPELKPVVEGTPLPENSKFLRLACACGYRMRIKTQNAGKTVKCPKCETPLNVPASAARSGGTIHFRLEDSFTSKLSKIISQFDEEAETTEESRTLSRFAFRSLRLSVESIAGGRFETERVRTALQELGESEDSRAYELLREAWESEPGNLQSDILTALGRSKDPRALSFLLQLLTHHLPEIRLYAVQSLAASDDPRVVPALLYYGLHQPDQKYAVSDSLLKMGETAVTPMLELLSSSDDRDLLTDIVLILGRLKSRDAIKPLMQLLKSDDNTIKGDVAEALGSIGDPKSMTALIPLLKSPDEKIRVQAAGALGRSPHPACLNALIEALRDEQLEVRKRCAAALGELGDSRAAPALVPLLKDQNTELRITAAESLGRIGDQRAVPYLLKMIDDEDESVILKALGALRKIKEPDAAPALMELLTHDNGRIRQRAADVLGQIGDAVVAERLEQMLKNDRSEDVRAAAAKALGEISDPGSVDVLIDALHDAFSVRCRALVALGEIGDEAALPPLLAMLKDPAPEIRYHATQALADLGHEAGIKNIQPLLDDSNAMVRRGAAKALETFGQGDAQTLLGSSTQQGFRRSLRKLKDLVAGFAPGELADSIQHGSTGTKAAIAGAILLPIILAGGYFLFFYGSQSAQERVALQLRGDVASVDISPDGNLVAVGRTTGVIETWDANAGERTDIFKPYISSDEISGIAIVPGGTQVVIFSSKNVAGFDLKSEKLIWEVSGHDAIYHRFQPSQDRSNIMVASKDGVVSFWDTTTGNPIGAGALALPRNQVQLIELSNDASTLAGVGGSPSITLWSTTDGSEVGTLDPYDSSQIVDLEFAKDDQALAISSRDGTLTVLDLKTAKPSSKFQDVQKDHLNKPMPFKNLNFVENGTKIAATLGRRLAVVDLASGTAEYTDLPITPAAVTFQPGGSLIGAGEQDEPALYLIERESGNVKAELDYVEY